MKTEVHFKSKAFNCTEARDHFINPCCFGDDVSRWLIGELRARGFKVEGEPLQEDWGWCVFFEACGKPHCFGIGFQPNDVTQGDQWIGFLERHHALIGSLLGRRRKGIAPEAVDAVNAVLSASRDIYEVSWHEPGQDS